MTLIAGMTERKISRLTGSDIFTENEILACPS